MTDVDAAYPFDETSEARLLVGSAHPQGTFRTQDPNRLRGIRDRGTAQFLLDLWEKIGREQTSGEARRREIARSTAEEKRRFEYLRGMATGALAGEFGNAVRGFALALLPGTDRDAQHLSEADLIDIVAEAQRHRDEWPRNRGR